VLLTGLLSSGGCSVMLGGGEDAPSTGLTGVVRRGPTQPTCSEAVPCDEPFAARFTVTLQGRSVATFRSDTAGRFRVALAPAAYRVVPAADAPILAPASQAKDVAVGRDGFTDVILDFDTGIR
jgi:hypothetical protein